MTVATLLAELEEQNIPLATIAKGAVTLTVIRGHLWVVLPEEHAYHAAVAEEGCRARDLAVHFTTPTFLGQSLDAWE